MYFFFFWDGRLPALGRTLSVFLFFSLFMIWAPGAMALKAFLFFCDALLMTSIFLLWPTKKLQIKNVRMENAIEGNAAKISAIVEGEKFFRAVRLGSYRMHPALKFLPAENFRPLPAFVSEEFFAKVQTSRRGVFELPHIAVAIPDALGVATILKVFPEKKELVVYPQKISVNSLNFLSLGISGRAFAPYLRPEFQRGQDFVGVREYREGDSLRDLHHKAFARYGKPFTKEFAFERGRGIVLLLDIACEKLADKARVENAVRLCAGVVEWLASRSLLGRFFIGNREITQTKNSPLESVMDALARAPYPELGKEFPKPERWAPAARPMAPVLSISVLPLTSDLITKQIIVAEENAESDSVLQIAISSAQGVSL